MSDIQQVSMTMLAECGTVLLVTNYEDQNSLICKYFYSSKRKGSQWEG